MRRRVLVALALILATARPAGASGPMFPTAEFVRATRPDSLDAFAAGTLGVPLPTWTRSFLVVAYRQMSGIRFDPAERRALVGFWEERLPGGDRGGAALAGAVDAWQAARARVKTAEPPPPRPDVMRPWGYQSYANCGADAFATATRTLEARIARFGAGSREVRAWAAGQDAVFAACAGQPTDPGPAPPGVAAIVRDDRDYQAAAAAFYGARFDEAARRFDAIARDADSPWRVLAPYLAARAMVRRGTLVPTDDDAANAAVPRVDTLALVDARRRLHRVLADPRRRETHDAARRLLGFVSIRLEPDRRMAELGRDLLAGGRGPSLRQDLWDYTWLLDRREARRAPDRAPSPSPGDLADWVFTFQRADAGAAAHALARWRATRAVPWLLAAMARVSPAHAEAPQLVAASLRVPTAHPAWAAIAWHRARLLAGGGTDGGHDAARRELDALLARQDLPPSARNLALRERLALARSADEALALAPRRAAALSYLADGMPLDAWALEDTALAAIQEGRPLFDDDGAAWLNRGRPLTALVQAARARALPSPLRARVARAAWTRAILLGRESDAVAVAPALATLEPSLAAPLAAWRRASAGDRAHEAALLLLAHPGLRPFVEPGVGRRTALSATNEYRDNWWCSSEAAGEGFFGFHARTATGAIPGAAPPRLPLQADEAALAEVRRLEAIASGPDWLGRRAIDWARGHRADPRVPEVLALVVRATRLGCARGGTSAISREAYRLLHARYTGSPAARRTPYWY